MLDVGGVIRHRLFRQHCVFHEGHYVKDLSLLGRPVSECVIVDNSQMSYLFHPRHAVPISSFIDSPLDRELPQVRSFDIDLINQPATRARTHLHTPTPTHTHTYTHTHTPNTHISCEYARATLPPYSQHTTLIGISLENLKPPPTQSTPSDLY